MPRFSVELLRSLPPDRGLQHVSISITFAVIAGAYSKRTNYKKTQKKIKSLFIKNALISKKNFLKN